MNFHLFRLALIHKAPQNLPAGSIEAALSWGRNFTYDVIMELADIYMRAGSPKQLVSSVLFLVKRFFSEFDCSCSTRTSPFVPNSEIG